VRRHSKYKDSGIPWLGQVPAHWEIKRLRHLGVLTASGIDKISKEGERLVTMINFVDVFNCETKRLKKGDFELMTTTAPEDKAIRHQVRRGDILITPSSEESSDIGRSALVDDDFNNTVYSYHLLRFTVSKQNTSPYYLSHFLNSTVSLSQLSSVAQGTTRQTLSRSDIKDIVVALPKYEEQIKISEFIDCNITTLNNAIKSQERMIELLKERIDSMVFTAISVQNLTQVRLGQVVELISRPIESNPSDSYVKLGLYNRGRGIFHKDESDNDDMGDSDFYYIRPSDLIISGQFAWEGAVAMAGESEDGCVVSHRYPVLRGIAGIAETEYILAFLCTEYGDFLLNEHSRGAAGRNRPLNIQSLLKEKIPLPSIQSQQKIVEAIKQRQVLLRVVARLNTILKERRSAIITQAVTGQIDVR